MPKVDLKSIQLTIDRCEVAGFTHPGHLRAESVRAKTSFTRCAQGRFNDRSNLQLIDTTIFIRPAPGQFNNDVTWFCSRLSRRPLAIIRSISSCMPLVCGHCRHICRNTTSTTSLADPCFIHFSSRPPPRATTAAHRSGKSRAKPARPWPPFAAKSSEFMKSCIFRILPLKCATVSLGCP